MIGELSYQPCPNEEKYLRYIKLHDESVQHLISRDLDINKPYDEQSLLMSAATFGNVESARILLDEGAEIDWTNANGESALFKAVAGKHTTMVNFLLERGANASIIGPNRTTLIHLCLENPQNLRKVLLSFPEPNLLNEFGSAPIHSAAYDCRLEAIDILLEFGANINITDNHGKTPLLYAVSTGNCDLVQYLLEKGADVKMQDNRKVSALHYAKTAEMINLLVENSADVNLTDHKGNTALHYRVKEVSLDLTDLTDLTPIKSLVNAQANINVKNNAGITPLMKSVKKNNPDLVDYLLSEGADPNNAEKGYESPLFYSCYYGNAEMVKKLHRAGAQTDFHFDGLGDTALHVACTSNSDDQDLLEIIRYLVEDVKLNVNKRCGTQGQNGTAVHDACHRESSDVLKLLIDKDKCKIDLEVSDRMGRRPIHLAAGSQSDCFQHLLSLGCNIHATDKTGRNALHWAAQGGSIDIVRRILDQPGVNIDTTDLDGWTALCWAARGPMPDGTARSALHYTLQAQVVKLLLDKGADKSVRVPVDENLTCTPLEIAIFHDTGDEAIQLLTEHPTDEDNLNSSQKRGFVHDGIYCNFCGVVSM